VTAFPHPAGFWAGSCAILGGDPVNRKVTGDARGSAAAEAQSLSQFALYSPSMDDCVSGDYPVMIIVRRNKKIPESRWKN